MRVQEHLKLSATAAVVALPWLKQDVWIPFVSSIFIDVDHYLWHMVTQRTLSLRAAVRYFGQANPHQTGGAKFLHHPLSLGILLFLAVRLRSRVLALILAGLLFHVTLDTVHITQMAALKQSLSAQAQGKCPQCGCQCDELQLHTLRFERNLLHRYDPKHFVVLCPTCHERLH